MTISRLAKGYAKAYIHFLNDNDITINTRDAYNMFRCAIHELYNVDYNVHCKVSKSIKDSCVKALRVAEHKVIALSEDDIKTIIEYSCVYALVLIQYCIGNIRYRNVDLLI